MSSATYILCPSIPKFMFNKFIKAYEDSPNDTAIGTVRIKHIRSIPTKIVICQSVLLQHFPQQIQK